MRGSTDLEVGELAVDAVVEGRVASLRLAGELDVRTVGALVEAYEPLFVGDVDAIHIDGTDLTFVDSAGLRAIVVGLVRATEAGIVYQVTEASDPFERVLAITGLSEALGR
jgi:anti-sigma B factor antagonist